MRLAKRHAPTSTRPNQNVPNSFPEYLHNLLTQIRNFRSCFEPPNFMHTLGGLLVDIWFYLRFARGHYSFTFCLHDSLDHWYDYCIVTIIIFVVFVSYCYYHVLIANTSVYVYMYIYISYIYYIQIHTVVVCLCIIYIYIYIHGWGGARGRGRW